MDSKGATMVNAVYDHFLRGKDTPIKGWELVAISPTIGVWKNDKSKTYAYASRGMITPEDAKVVPKLMSSKVHTTARYKKDREFAKKHQPPAGYRRIGFGHSLGGAMMDQLLEDKLVDSATTFNPAIELSKMKNSGNKRMYNRHDFLYKLVGMYASNVHTINNDFFSRVSAGANFLNIALSYYTHNLDQFVDKEHREKHKNKNADKIGEEHKGGDEPRPSLQPTTSHQNSYMIQTVVLHKSKFPTIDEAREWIVSHKYKVNKMDETANEYRFRQVSPEILKTGKYHERMIPIGDVGYLGVLYK